MVLFFWKNCCNSLILSRFPFSFPLIFQRIEGVEVREKVLVRGGGGGGDAATGQVQVFFSSFDVW